MRETAITVHQCFIAVANALILALKPYMRPDTHMYSQPRATACTRVTCTCVHARHGMLAWPQVHGKGAGNGNGRRGRWVQRRRNDGGHDRRAERGRDEGGGERNGVHVGGSVQCAVCTSP